MIISATRSKVQEYIDGVLDGSIVTGELVRLAVERHVNDLKRQSQQGFGYYFDATTAECMVEFFPAMLQHTIGDFVGKAFELEPWQAFAVWCIYGWKRDEDNSRRFRKVYWSMARKNGKSCVAAGMAFIAASLDVNPETASPESVAEVILCASKKEQVEKVIYAEIERMRVRSKPLAKISNARNRQITFAHNQGLIRCIGSDRPYDGLNPHCVIMDELHAWREHHRKFYDTMQTGSGYRRQPLIVSVTTAGDDQSYIWKDEYEYAKQVLRSEARDEHLFAYVFELDDKDDPLDETCWIKANPNLDVSVRSDYLRDIANAAKHSKLKMNQFLRYHCNKLVTSTERPIDPKVWARAKSVLSNWKQADAVTAGVDLGSRDDLAAYALCARFPVGKKDGRQKYRYEIRTQTYLSDETNRDLRRKPMADWIYEDRIRKRKFATTELCDDLIAECEELGVEHVGYDPYNGQMIGERVKASGMTDVRVGQTYVNFNEPIHEFMKCLEDGRIVHDGDPVLAWAAGNAAIVRNREDRWMFDKASSDEKIDPLVAAVMAFRLCMLAKERATGKLFIV